MKTEIYNSIKKLAIPYLACLQGGFFGYHKTTNTFLLISHFAFENNSVKHYACKMIQNEDGEIYFADVIYSDLEIQFTNISKSSFEEKHNELQGIQLSLF